MRQRACAVKAPTRRARHRSRMIFAKKAFEQENYILGIRRAETI
jgi:hypothetical protein